MTKTRTISHVIEQLLPWAVLAVVLFFTYIKFFAYPYAGFRWDSNGQVVYIFTDGNSVNPLQIGDYVLQADSVSWMDYKQDLRTPLLDYPKRGQVVQLRVERNGQEIMIPWAAPGPNSEEIMDMVFTSGWIGLVFWLLGTITFHKLQPKNERWKLLVAFNFLTAIWLTVGSGLSILHIWESAIVLRVFVWLSVPVYLHLHWIFPKPFGRPSPVIVWGGYLVTAVLVVAQLFQALPQSFYYLGFLLSVIGSFILLVVHAIRQPGSRNEIRALITVAFLSFAPAIVIGLLSTVVTLKAGMTELGVISLPLLPLAYFYAALRRQFGGLELRFNQAFSVYIYTVFLGVLLLPLLALVNLWISGPGSGVTIGVMTLIVTVLVTIFGYPRAQAFFERILLGVSPPPSNLLELYSERITTSTSLADLQKIMQTEILPRLHIREFAFLQISKGQFQERYTAGRPGADLPVENALVLSGQQAGKYRPIEASAANDPFAWVRLSLELKIKGELVGLWLFGRRDPEDFYSQAEIKLLQALANQKAVAMSNILQTQRVLEMYQQDISQHEKERMRLALDLHDSILNQMASLSLSLDDQAISPRFQAANDELTDSLREIVSDLRPPMLNYGLKLALDELAENLVERDKNGLEFTLDLQPGETRYPVEVEQHLFRIIQEACENALRHGQARRISLTGSLLPDKIDLTIADNGIGFETSQGFDLAGLLADKHFGLAGMLERARLIGGDVDIDSHPATGTRVNFRWVSSRNSV